MAWVMDDALAAGDALVIVDVGLAVLAHGDGVHGAGPLAGTHVLHNGVVGAGGYALAAQNALVVVDDRAVVHNGDSPLGTDLLTPVGNTAPAGLAHADLAHRALVAGHGEHLHHRADFLVAAHGHLDTLVDNGPLLVDAAAHLRLGAGDDLLGNLEQRRRVELILPGQLGHRGEHLVL